MLEHIAQPTLIKADKYTDDIPLDSSIAIEHINCNISDYQLFQRRHDLAYHHDIMVLGINRQMSHVALHLIKYASPLSFKSKSDLENRKAFVDSFIMIVSASNLLGVSLKEINLSREEYCSEREFMSSYIIFLADLAKACEASDHQEDFPIRKMWHSSIKNFFSLLVKESISRRISILDEAVYRLECIERNNSLYSILSQKI